MEIKQINEILLNLSNPTSTQGVKFVEKVVQKEMDGESQGEYGEYSEIYSTPIPDVFLRINYRTDSYGSNDFIHSVQFVKIATKSITVYETL